MAFGFLIFVIVLLLVLALNFGRKYYNPSIITFVHSGINLLSRKFMFTFFLFLLGTGAATYASHIQGGQVYYQIANGNTIRIFVVIYSDCLLSPVPDNINLGNPDRLEIFDATNNNLIAQYTGTGANSPIQFVGISSFSVANPTLYTQSTPVGCQNGNGPCSQKTVLEFSYTAQILNNPLIISCSIGSREAVGMLNLLTNDGAIHFMTFNAIIPPLNTFTPPVLPPNFRVSSITYRRTCDDILTTTPNNFVDISVIDGVPPYTLSLPGSDFNGVPQFSNNFRCRLLDGDSTYTGSVTDGNGNSFSFSFDYFPVNPSVKCRYDKSTQTILAFATDMPSPVFRLFRRGQNGAYLLLAGPINKGEFTNICRSEQGDSTYLIEATSPNCTATCDLVIKDFCPLRVTNINYNNSNVEKNNCCANQLAGDQVQITVTGGLKPYRFNIGGHNYVENQAGTYTFPSPISVGNLNISVLDSHNTTLRFFESYNNCNNPTMYCNVEQNQIVARSKFLYNPQYELYDNQGNFLQINQVGIFNVTDNGTYKIVARSPQDTCTATCLVLFTKTIPFNVKSVYRRTDNCFVGTGDDIYLRVEGGYPPYRYHIGNKRGVISGTDTLLHFTSSIQNLYVDGWVNDQTGETYRFSFQPVVQPRLTGGIINSLTSSAVFVSAQNLRSPITYRFDEVTYNNNTPSFRFLGINATGFMNNLNGLFDHQVTATDADGCVQRIIIRSTITSKRYVCTNSAFCIPSEFNDGIYTYTYSFGIPRNRTTGAPAPPFSENNETQAPNYNINNTTLTFNNTPIINVNPLTGQISGMVNNPVNGVYVVSLITTVSQGNNVISTIFEDFAVYSVACNPFNVGDPMFQTQIIPHDNLGITLICPDSTFRVQVLQPDPRVKYTWKVINRGNTTALGVDGFLLVSDSTNTHTQYVLNSVLEGQTSNCQTSTCSYTDTGNVWIRQNCPRCILTITSPADSIVICEGDPVLHTISASAGIDPNNQGLASNEFIWYPDGTIGNTKDINNGIPQVSTTYTIASKTRNTANCHIQPKVVKVLFHQRPKLSHMRPIVRIPDTLLCPRETLDLEVCGACRYDWSFRKKIGSEGEISHEYVSNSRDRIKVWASDTGTYIAKVIGIGSNSCQSLPDSFVFKVRSLPKGEIEPRRDTICENETTVVKFKPGTLRGKVKRWEFVCVDNDGDSLKFNPLSAEGDSVVVIPPADMKSDKICFYKVVITNEPYCNDTIADTTKITISHRVDSLKISPPLQIICKKDPPRTVGFKASFKGGGRIIRWEYSDNCVEFQPVILNVVSDSLTVDAPPNTRCYRAVVKNGVCDDQYTPIAKVQLQDTTIGGTVSGNKTIIGTCASPLNKVTFNLLNQRGRIIRWEYSSNDFATHTEILDTVNSIEHMVPFGLGKVCYRALIQNAPCPPVYSKSYCVDTAKREIVVVNKVKPTCIGGDDGEITVRFTGKVGAYSYELWRETQFLTNGNIPDSTNLTFTNLSAGIYRVLAKDTFGCELVEKNISLEDTFRSVRIRADRTEICQGDTTYIRTDSLSGDILKWEISCTSVLTGGNPSFRTLPNSGGQSFILVAPPVSVEGNQICRYRITVGKKECSDSIYKEIVINIYKKLKDIPVTPDSQAFCKNDLVGTFSISISSDTPGNVIRWESSTDCRSFTSPVIISSTTKTLVLPRPNIETCYRAVIKNGVCDSVNSSIAKVTLINESIGGKLNTDKTEVGSCAGSNNIVNLNLTGQVGQVIRWEYSLNEFSTWNSIVLTNTTLTTSVPYTAPRVCYRAVVRNTPCPIIFSDTLCVNIVHAQIDAQVVNQPGCVGANDAQISLLINGGAGPYNFILLKELVPITSGKINDGQTNIFPSLNAGVYQFIVTDRFGCTQTRSVTIIDPPRLISRVEPKEPCDRNSGGRVTVFLNYSGTFEFRWSDGVIGNSASRNDLIAGSNYTVTVVNTANNCTDVISFAVPPNRNLEPLASLTNYIYNPTCNGGCNGAIGHDVTGGQPPYRYKWAHGPTTEDIENICAGTYTITVTDAIDCIFIKTFVVTQPAPLQIITDYIQSVGCYQGSDGAIGINVIGGTPPYSYAWSNGALTEDVDQLTAGLYEIFVRDANGCNLRQTYTITQPAPITATFTTQSTSCSGFADGSATVIPAGGTPPYTYLWSNGSTTQTMSNVRNGGYSVAVRDARGCIKTFGVTVGTVNPIIALVNYINNVGCYGESDGGIGITIYGGNPEYTYQWRKIDDPSFFADTEDLLDLSAGIYEITVTDRIGCHETFRYTITQPAAPLEVKLNLKKDVSCHGLSDGILDITVSGGTPAYLVFWSNGARTTDLFNIPAGTYTVSIFDAQACRATQTFTVTQADPLEAEINFIRPVQCHGGNDGSIGLQVSGGTVISPTVNYNYQWSNGAVTEDLEHLTAGTYTLTVTDKNGCTLVRTYTITQPSEIEVRLLSVTRPKCHNTSDGVIDMEVVGGVPPYIFSWSDGSTNEDLRNVPAGLYRLMVTDQNGCIKQTFDIPVSAPAPLTAQTTLHRDVSCKGGANGTLIIVPNGGTTPYTAQLWQGSMLIGSGLLFSNLPAGTYQYKLKDGNGCEFMLWETITEPENALEVTVQVDQNVSCNGGNDGKATILTTGGVSPYSYRWSDLTIGSFHDRLSAGHYLVTVTDANGCNMITTVSITQPGAITVNLVSKKNVTCKGYNNGEITVSASGGTGNLTYYWNSNQNTPTVDGLQPAIYSVTVTDDKGCQAVLGNLLITEPASPLVIQTSYIQDERCGGLNEGSIGVDVTGGTPPYLYAWSNGFYMEDPAHLAPGTYVLTVTDAQGCIAIKSFQVNGPTQALYIENLYITEVTCNGGSDGTIGLDVRGGTSPYTVLWSNGNTNEDIYGLTAGIYRLEVRDANNCILLRSYEVFQATPLVAIAEEINPSARCSGTGWVRVMVSGGQEPYTYSWSDGSMNRDLTNVLPGTYQLTIRDGLGCVKVLGVTVPALPELNATIKILRNEICAGSGNGILDLTVTGGLEPYTYLWSNGATIEDISNAGSGLIGVIVTDASGCVFQISIDLPAVQPLEIGLGVKVDIRCAGQTGTGVIGINVSGGESPYTYQWSNGAITQNLTGLNAGAYLVTVTDARGCRAEARFDINEPAPLNMTENYVQGERCAGTQDGSISVQVTGGVPPYRYTWNNGEASNVITNLSGGTYSLTVTDANGCQLTRQYILTSPQPLTAVVASIQPANCNGGTNGGADIAVNGGTRPYTYRWSNSRMSEDLVGVPAGTYTLTVTDAHACSTTVSVTINTYVLPPVFILNLPSAICSNAGAVTLSGIPSGGTFSGSGITGNTFNPSGLSAGNYTITYSGVLNGCSYAKTATVQVIGTPNVNPITFDNLIQTEFCRTDNNNYRLRVNPNESGVTYAFSGPGVSRSGNSNIYNFNPSDAGAGTHTITVVARNTNYGCQTTFTLPVTVSNPAVVTATALNATVCTGGSTILIASGTASRYEWTPDQSLNTNIGQIVTATPTRSTTYTVTAINGGCRTTATVRVTVVPPTPVTVSVAPGGSVCAGVPVTLTANGGNGVISYQWSPATGLNQTQGASVMAQVNQTTTYTVTATNSNGCTTTATATVSITPSPITVTATQTTLCAGNSTTLTATGGANYYWYPGGLTGSSITVSPTATTTYTVQQGNNPNTCNRAIIRIEVINVPVSIGVQNQYCVSNTPVTAVLQPSGGTFYIDGMESNGTFIPAQLAETGTQHYLEYTGTYNGCEYNYSRIITITSEGLAQILNVRDVYCRIAPGHLIVVSPFGGSLTIDGQPNSFLDPNALGMGYHTVRYAGTDANGCIYDVSKRFLVTEPNVVVTLPENICSGLGQLDLTPFGQPAGGQWQLFGQSQPLPGNLLHPQQMGSGSYMISYFGRDNVSGCTYSRSISFSIGNTMTVRTTQIIQPSTFNSTDGAITVEALGGGNNLQYSLNGGAWGNNPSFISLNAATYTITVRDNSPQGGCTGSITVTLNPFNCPQVTITSVTRNPSGVTVSWNAPVPNAIGYEVQWRYIGQNNWRDVPFISNPLQSNTSVPATGGTAEIRVRVRCTNNQWGAWSITAQGRLDDLSNTVLDLEIYPNPTQGLLNIQLRGVENERAKIFIYDLAGREVFRKEEILLKENEPLELNLKGISSGIYSLRVVTNNFTKVTKVVIE